MTREWIMLIASLRAAAFLWQGNIDAARRVVTWADAAVNRHPDTYWHGWLAMVAMRMEGDTAAKASASKRLDLIDRAHDRVEESARCGGEPLRSCKECIRWSTRFRGQSTPRWRM